jgi:hypothetical protein
MSQIKSMKQLTDQLFPVIPTAHTHTHTLRCYKQNIANEMKLISNLIDFNEIINFSGQ